MIAFTTRVTHAWPVAMFQSRRVLAPAGRRHHPGHGREGPRCGRAKKSAYGATLPNCPLCRTVWKPGSGFEDRVRGASVPPGLAGVVDAAVRADVVAPAHARLAQHPGDVAPGVGHLRALLQRPPLIGLADRWVLQLIGSVRSGQRAVQPDTTHRCDGKRPGVGGREHVVLEQVVTRVRPVVRDLLGGVVAHHVGRVAGTGVR